MRIVQRTCEVMHELKTDDPARVRAAGALDLPTLQKFINFHYSVSLDLFGQELSTNGANYFTSGLKGRYHETRLDDDHRLLEATWPVALPKDNVIVVEEHPALLAINERLRDDYIVDSERGLRRWNKVIQTFGIEFTLTLPHRGFHRRIGVFAEVQMSPAGQIMPEAEWLRNVGNWLPTKQDHAFVASLMQPVVTPGQMAGWIAPPPRGIHGKPIYYEYVKFH
jgi:benzoyl-CoA 2,3-dioxygenase component B